VQQPCGALWFELEQNRMCWVVSYIICRATDRAGDRLPLSPPSVQVCATWPTSWPEANLEVHIWQVGGWLASTVASAFHVTSVAKKTLSQAFSPNKGVCDEAKVGQDLVMWVTGDGMILLAHQLCKTREGIVEGTSLLLTQ